MHTIDEAAEALILKCMAEVNTYCEHHYNEFVPGSVSNLWAQVFELIIKATWAFNYVDGCLVGSIGL